MNSIKKVSKIARQYVCMLTRILPKRDNVRFYVTTKEAAKEWSCWLKGSSGQVETAYFVLNGDASYVKDVIDTLAAENPDCVINAVIQAKKA